VTTLHGRLDLLELQPIYNLFRTVPVVSISDAQRKPLPQAGWVRTVYHGMPETLVTPSDAKPSYLAFLGRIAPEKAVDRAIRIASLCGLPLKIAAKVDKVDREYFQEQIRPLLNSHNVEYIGEINDQEKTAFLGGAIGLLVPVNWPEPFGLVMIEAMAAGTPVIGFNQGSVPEIVENGLTGFVVEDEAAAVKAVPHLVGLSRARIRQRFEERFTARRMARDYLEIYDGLMTSEAPQLKVAALRGQKATA